MKTINFNRLETICGKELSVFQKQAIYQWGKEFEDTVRSELNREYKQDYQRDLGQAVDYFIIAIAFTLHFNEKTRFGRKRLFDVLKDIQETVDMFRKREYSPQEYVKMLHDEKIDIKVKWR